MEFNLSNNVSNKIKIVRASRGMTQTQLSEATGLSQWFISEVERGRVNPTVDELERIKAALNWTSALDVHLEALAQ